MVKKILKNEQKVKKKKNYVEIFCPNKYLSKCKSRTMVYKDRTIVSSHNSRCINKMKKEQLAIKEKVFFEKDVNKEDEDKEVEEEEELNDNEKSEKQEDDKEEEDDTKICFVSKTFENFYRKIHDNIEQLLQNKESELKNLFKKKDFKISELINFQNRLEEEGFGIYPKESFKLLKDKSDIKTLFNLMRNTFKRHEEYLLSWIEEHTVKGYFIFNELVGGVVYKHLKIKDNKASSGIIQIILLMVEKDRRNHGIGRNIMLGIMNYNKKIILYTDYKAIRFYERLGFNILDERDSLRLSFKYDMIVQRNKTAMMILGFDKSF
jgi:GNAT superfamily N-acetyltransferase